MVLSYGSEDVQWELYVGDRRLDRELVQLGGYKLGGDDDHFSVEILLYSPGVAYEVRVGVGYLGWLTKVSILFILGVFIMISYLTAVSQCSFLELRLFDDSSLHENLL